MQRTEENPADEHHAVKQKKRGSVGAERCTAAVLEGSSWKERRYSMGQRTVYITHRNFAHHRVLMLGIFWHPLMW